MVQIHSSTFAKGYHTIIKPIIGDIVQWCVGNGIYEGINLGYHDNYSHTLHVKLTKIIKPRTDTPEKHKLLITYHPDINMHNITIVKQDLRTNLGKLMNDIYVNILKEKQNVASI